MANVLVNDLYLSDIADAIREKLNVQTTYKPSEMANAIESISGGGSTINNQNKTVHPSSSQQSITADSGYTGLGTVTVKGVTVENLSAANIVSGVTVKIGDADDDDSIASVAGTASSGGITPTGTKQISITQNGTTTEDVTNYASAQITANVPNSYSLGDEGKVVSNGALVSQTSDTVTVNDTYDTTLINSLTVNVSGGGSGSGLELLDTLQVSNERGCQIDIGSDWLDDYVCILIVPDLTISATDWIYIKADATTGGDYTNKINTFGSDYTIIVSGNTSAMRYTWWKTSTSMTNVAVTSYLYVYAYGSSSTMNGTIKVYGMRR